MKKSVFPELGQHSIALAMLLVLFALPAWAEKADKQKPVNVEADKMQYDDIKQINIFYTSSIILNYSQISKNNLIIV